MEKWIIYNNVKCKRSWGKQNESSLPIVKSGLYPKNAMNMVGLKKSSLMWTPSREANDSFKQILLPIRSTEGSNWQKVSRIS